MTEAPYDRRKSSTTTTTRPSRPSRTRTTTKIAAAAAATKTTTSSKTMTQSLQPATAVAAFPTRPPKPQQAANPANTVYLNVYDVLTPSDSKTIPRLNDFLVHCGVGIFHTGIQVWGREFAFGGHGECETGIFEVAPRKCPSVRYRTTLRLGVTQLSERHVEHVIRTLGVCEYLGYNYSLISRNCNTFSSHFAGLLGVDSNFPAWVNRLAVLALHVRCLLPEPLLHPLCDGVPGAALLQEPQKPPPVATL